MSFCSFRNFARFTQTHTLDTALSAFWLAELAATKWLEHICIILGSAVRAVALLEAGHSVLVHWCVVLLVPVLRGMH